MNKNLIIVILIVIVLGGGIFFINQKQDAPNSSDNQMMSDEEKNTMTQDDNRPVKEFEFDSFTEIIDGKYFPQFSTKEITVNKGDLVRLKITVTSGSHDFKIDEFDVYSETPTNETTVIEFVADQEGEFVYYCNKPGHRANGHWGTLKVI